MRSKIALERLVIGVIVPIIALVLLASCKSPTGPSDKTCTDHSAINLNSPLPCRYPVAGTVHEFTVPGQSIPVRIWLVEFTPTKDSFVDEGQFYRLTFTLTGPPAIATIKYSLLDGDVPLMGDGTDPCDISSGGGTEQPLTSNPSVEMGKLGNLSKTKTPHVSDMFWRIWVKTANGYPTCGDSFKEHIGWTVK